MFLRGPGSARLCIGLLTLAVLCSVWVAAPPAEARKKARGIDVSHWQRRIRWRPAARDGVDFAFIKATEGNRSRDWRYRSNRKRAEVAGVLVGAYHFARPSGSTRRRLERDARREARWFLKVAAPRHPNLLPVLDVETRGTLSRRRLKVWLAAWLNAVHARIGVRAIIYSNVGFWRDEMRGTRAFARRGHRLWVAHYTRRRPRVPARSWGGKGWTFWQHTDCGRVRGIKGCVDRNRFSGKSLRDLMMPSPVGSTPRSRKAKQRGRARPQAKHKPAPAPSPESEGEAPAPPSAEAAPDSPVALVADDLWSLAKTALTVLTGEPGAVVTEGEDVAEGSARGATPAGKHVKKRAKKRPAKKCVPARGKARRDRNRARAGPGHSSKATKRRGKKRPQADGRGKKRTTKSHGKKSRAATRAKKSRKARNKAATRPRRTKKTSPRKTTRRCRTAPARTVRKHRTTRSKNKSGAHRRAAKKRRAAR